MTRAKRDTGVSWLGALPAEWETIPLGRLTKPVKRSGISDAPLLSLYLGEGIVPYKADRIVHATSEDTSAYQLVMPGDFVMNNQQAWRGSVAVSEIRGIISPAYVVCSSSPRLSARYARYLFSCTAARFPQMLSSRGVGDIQRNLSWQLLKTQEFPVPPRTEQHAIADYLDRETAQIDALISKQQRLIETLRERRSAVVEQEFFGTDGKRLTTVRRTLAPLSRPAVPGLGVITAYRDGTVTLRSNRRDDGYTFSDTEHGYQEIRPGDLVFHALDGFAGAVGISDSHGVATPVYHVCRATAGDDLRYVSMLLRYLGTSGFLAAQAPNVRQRSVDFRNWGMFARVPLALPDIERQRAAVRTIDEQTAKIDALIAKAERFIAVSKERRSALITAAVTGQIDVRERVGSVEAQVTV